MFEISFHKLLSLCVDHVEYTYSNYILYIYDSRGKRLVAQPEFPLCVLETRYRQFVKRVHVVDGLSCQCHFDTLEDELMFKMIS